MTCISRRCKSHSGHGRSSDSSRSSCLPGITPVAKVRCSFFVDSQQRVLSRIFTGFPFHSESVNLPKPFSGCKIIYITCHIQTIHIIFTIKHTRYDNGRVHQQVQSYRRLSKKHCFGVKKSSFSLGLLLSLCCMALILASVKESKSACFGMYLLMSLFAFSIAPFCHEE